MSERETVLKFMGYSVNNLIIINRDVKLRQRVKCVKSINRFREWK